MSQLLPFPRARRRQGHGELHHLILQVDEHVIGFATDTQELHPHSSFIERPPPQERRYPRQAPRHRLERFRAGAQASPQCLPALPQQRRIRIRRSTGQSLAKGGDRGFGALPQQRIGRSVDVERGDGAFAVQDVQTR